MNNILCASGFTFVWLQQETGHPKWLKGVLHKRLADINRLKWHNEMNVNSHFLIFKIMFKDNLRCEPYTTLLNTRQRMTLCKFRCGNTNIPIVSGRYQTVNRSERTYNLCDAGVIGNAFHYAFKCKAFSLERKLYIQKSLRNMPSIYWKCTNYLIVVMLKYC